MTAQGFPESYKPYLRALHQKYPYWQFKAFKTGVKFQDALTAESKLGENLISNSKSEAWKSKEAGAYDVPPVPGKSLTEAPGWPRPKKPLRIIWTRETS